jgi:hypothetical protein
MHVWLIDTTVGGSQLVALTVCVFLLPGVVQDQGSPAWFMAASHSTSPLARNLSHVALISEEATKYIAHA